MDAYRQLHPDQPMYDMTLSYEQEDAIQFAVDALALNYRINFDIQDHLELIDDKAIVSIISSVIELDVILEVHEEKKVVPSRVEIPVG